MSIGCSLKLKQKEAELLRAAVLKFTKQGKRIQHIRAGLITKGCKLSKSDRRKLEQTMI